MFFPVTHVFTRVLPGTLPRLHVLEFSFFNFPPRFDFVKSKNKLNKGKKIERIFKYTIVVVNENFILLELVIEPVGPTEFIFPA